MLPFGANKTVGDVVPDSSGEKNGFLGNETDLATKPLDVELSEVDTIQSDDTRQRVVEPLDQGDNGRLSRSGSTNQGDVGSGFNGEGKILDDWDVGAGWVVELDVLEGDAAVAALRLQPSRIS